MSDQQLLNVGTPQQTTTLQGAAPAPSTPVTAYVEEAPLTGEQYARVNGSWQIVKRIMAPDDPSVTTVMQDLIDGPLVSWDLSLGGAATLVLSTSQSARMLINPTYMQEGVTYTLMVKQGAAGGQTITYFGDAFTLLQPLVINQAPNAVTLLTMFSDGARMYVSQPGASYIPPAPPPPTPAPPAPTPAPGPTPAPAPGTSQSDYIEVLVDHEVDFLEAGDVKRYWANDGVWGTTSSNPSVDPHLTRGSAAWQYRQKFERSLLVNEDGSVAGEWDCEWPLVNEFGHSTDPLYNSNYPEVKTYPSWIYGQKPGYGSTGPFPGFVVTRRAPDGVIEPVPNPSWAPDPIKAKWQPAGGSVLQDYPSGKTPGTLLPLQLPLTGKTMRMRGRIKFRSPPTGRGHIAFDMFLQQTAAQGTNFTAASITHEIMIPLWNWGDYGSHSTRNPGWYSHDATIDGVLFHVYCTKDSPVSDITGSSDGLGDMTQDGFNWYSGLRYNFSGLQPNFTNEETGQPRIGWKFMIFVPDDFADMMDVDGYFNINYISFLEHLATCQDSRGINWIQNTEYVPSIEVGSEIVSGNAKYVIENYLVHDALTVVAMPPKPVFVAPGPAPAPPPPSPAPSPAPTPAPSPTPAPPAPTPAPPNGESLITAMFVGGNQGVWLDNRALTEFDAEAAVPGVAPAGWTDLVGRWKNHAGIAANHLVQVDNASRMQLGTDTGGKHFASGYMGSPIKNIGGSTSKFYCALMVDITAPSYDCTLLSDSNAANVGVKIEQEAYEQVIIAKFGTGAATVQVKANYTALVGNSGDPHNLPLGKALVEAWHDGTNVQVQVNAIDPGAAGKAACGAISPGAADMMLLSAVGDGSGYTEQMTARVYEGVVYKNNCPTPTDRVDEGIFVAAQGGLAL